MEEERNEMEIRTKEKLNKEQEEETALMQWLQEEILTKKSDNQIVDKNGFYYYITGNLSGGKVTLSYCNTYQYVPQYVDGKDFLYIIRKVIDQFNQLENYRMVGVLPFGEKGEIEIYIYIDTSSTETEN